MSKAFDRAMKRALSKQQNTIKAQATTTAKAEPTPASAPALTQEQIDQYVSMLVKMDSESRYLPGENATEMLIRERLEAQGLSPAK